MTNYTSAAVLGVSIAALAPHANVSTVQVPLSDASYETALTVPAQAPVSGTDFAVKALGALSWNAQAQQLPGGNNQQPCTNPQGCGGIPGITNNFNSQNNPFYQATQNFVAAFAPGMAVPGGLCAKGWSVSLAAYFASAGFSKADQDRECNRWRVLEAGAGNAICPIAYAAVSYAVDPTQVFRDLMKEGFNFCVDYERARQQKPKDERDGFNIINPGVLGNSFAMASISMPANENTARATVVKFVARNLAVKTDELTCRAA